MGGLCQNPLSEGSLFSIGLTYLNIKGKAYVKPGSWAKIGSQTWQTSVELAILARFRNPVPSLEFWAVPSLNKQSQSKTTQ
jgi:hypothetical protein